MTDELTDDEGLRAAVAAEVHLWTQDPFPDVVAKRIIRVVAEHITALRAQPAADAVEAGGWTGLAAELFRLHRAAYPAPWCWEQCGDKCDDPVIGAAWWDDDEDCTPIVGEVVPPPDNVDRALYRESIALEMQSHADGVASANAALIVWLRNHVVEILNALTTLPPKPAGEADAGEAVADAIEQIVADAYRAGTEDTLIDWKEVCECAPLPQHAGIEEGFQDHRPAFRTRIDRLLAKQGEG